MWDGSGRSPERAPANGVFYCHRHSHNERRTTFSHPQTGLTSDDNSNFILQELAPRSRVMSKPELSSVGSKTSQASKVHSFGKRHLSVKRNLNINVERRGWIYKQDGSGMRLWKRKWFVLSDYCLFYYKDSREQTILGSIPLPSYEVSPVGAEDHVSRKFAFKACPFAMATPRDKWSTGIGPFKCSSSVIGPFKCSSSVIGRQAQHPGMRTYFFSAETQDDMNAWITSMNRASRVQDQTRDRPTVQTGVPNQGQAEVHNGLRKVHNGVHCGTNTTTDRRSDPLNPLELLDSSRSSEQTLVHEVQLEPPCRVQKCPDPVTTATTHLTSPPQDPVSVQSRFNDLDKSPSPILEPNGIAAGTYQTSPAPDTPPGTVYRQSTPMGSAYTQATPTGTQTTPTGRQATPPISSIRDQVQNWVKVQREEHKRSASRNSLHRSTPPTQFSPIEPPQIHTAPHGRSGEYRYAQDRLSHFGLDAAVAPPQFWRLYEWQQRHQYRRGNPTAPLYSPVPLHPFGPHPPTAADRPRAPTPRCIEVPPSAAEIPPSLPSAPISRRPHTPAERLTVRPTNESAAASGAFTLSPRRSQSQYFKASTLDRRSLPVTGHMTHTISTPSLHGKTVDESYLQLKKDLEYLDLKAGGTTLKNSKPVRAAESDIDVKLSRLCEQDKSLKELESRISTLTEDKEQLEGVLALSHQQMEQFSDPEALQKISLHQRLLQEDLVQLRAQLSRAFTDMCRSWEQYVLLETSVEQLRSALTNQLDLGSTAQLQRANLKRELWRIEDVLAGLSSSRAHYSNTIQALTNPERMLVASVEESEPSPPPHTQPPPRPPLPHGFDKDEDSAPEVPPLPREAAAIRHTSVRGLKRQSDERRRDREGGDWKFQTDLRSFLSEPELPVDSTYSHHTGLLGSSSGLKQSSVSAFVTMRRGVGDRERPKSAVECSNSSSVLDPDWLSSVQSRGRMSADEQRRRMRRHHGTAVGPLDHSSAQQVCAHGAPPPTPKRSSSRERHRHILNTRLCP